METVWTLRKSVIDDIQATFTGYAKLYQHLSTSNKYWGPKICKKGGVKERTAETIALKYLELLRDVHENKFTGDGVRLSRAHMYYKKYSNNISTLSVTSMLCRIDEADDSSGAEPNVAQDLEPDSAKPSKTPPSPGEVGQSA